MKMKKKITALVLGLAMTAGSAVCGAEGVEWLTANDVSLGGVQPHMSLEYVQSIYGPMKQAKAHYIDHVFCYGDSVKIVPTSDGMGVKSVIIKANNGWATPAGVTVGMDASILQKIYGTGAATPGVHKSHHMPGYTYYTYWPASDHSIYLTFAVKDGKIAYMKTGAMEH